MYKHITNILMSTILIMLIAVLFVNQENDEKHEHTQKEATDVFDEQNITAFLIKTNNPIANINLPRLINKESSMQAANPAFEITRLSSMLGFGSKGFKFLSIILVKQIGFIKYLIMAF